MIWLCVGAQSALAAPENAPPAPVQAATEQQSQAWWTVRFILPWDKHSEPKWHLGTLLAGEVIAPLLPQLSPAPRLWRFHRRAKDDAIGFAFSFIFYSSTQVAEQVYASINTSAAVQQFKEKALLTEVVLDDLKNNSKTQVADTSDAEWPEPIRKTWPVFMTGASQMWLDLINELQGEAAQAQSQEEKYQIIETKIALLWQKNGQHAWLHHLSGLYGYTPIAIRY